MDPSNRVPIRPGRLEPLRPNVPEFLLERSRRSIGPGGWAMFDRIYPTHVVVQVDPGKVTEHRRVNETMAGGAHLHTVAVEVRGWGQVVVGGMVSKELDVGQVVVCVTLDYALTRDLMGLQLDAPLDWQWMTQLRLAEVMTLRAREMMKGLVATWARVSREWEGPTAAVLGKYERLWKFDDGAAVYQPDLGVDLRDPTTWRA